LKTGKIFKIFRNYKSPIIYSAALLLISFFLYIPSLNNQFVWDDLGALKKKNYVFGGFVNLIIPKQAVKKGNYYRPTVYLSFYLDKSVWGLNPFGYHLSNLIFNSFTVLLVFWFVFFFFDSLKTSVQADKIAFLSSLIFSLHPIHVESVSWIAGRTDVLCTLFLMLGLLFHLISYKQLLFIPFAVLSFYLSLLSKELAVVFFLLVLILDFTTGQLKKRRNLIIYFAYVFILFAYFYLRTKSYVNITAVSERNINIAVESDFLKYLDIIKVLVSVYYAYIYKLLFPFQLNAFITEVIKELYYLVSAFIVLSSLAFVLIYSIIKKYFIISFTVFWIMITLAPSALLSIIKMTPTSLAERYLYLPSVGFALIFGYFLYLLLQKNISRKITLSVLMIIIVLYISINLKRQGVWADDLSLWGDTSLKTTNSCLVYNNYGSALKRAGRLKEALIAYKVGVDPEMKCRKIEKALVFNNLGIITNNKEEYLKARQYFIKAIEYGEYYFSPYMNLGISFLSTALDSNSTKDFDSAKELLAYAIELKPRSAKSHHYLSIVYKETGDFKNAEIHAKEALRLGIPPAQKRDALRILDEIQNSAIKEN